MNSRRRNRRYGSTMVLGSDTSDGSPLKLTFPQKPGKQENVYLQHHDKKIPAGHRIPVSEV